MLMPGINAQSTLQVSDNIGDIHGGDMPASKGKGCKKKPQPVDLFLNNFHSICLAI